MESKILDFLKFLGTIPKPVLLMFITLPIVLSLSFINTNIPGLLDFLNKNQVVMSALWIISISGILLLICEGACYMIILGIKRWKTSQENKKRQDEISQQQRVASAEAIRLQTQQNIINQEIKNLRIRQKEHEKEIFEKKLDDLTNPAKKLLSHTFGNYPYQRGSVIRFEYGCKEQGALDELVNNKLLNCREHNASRKASKGSDEYWVPNDVYDVLKKGIGHTTSFKIMRDQTRHVDYN